MQLVPKNNTQVCHCTSNGEVQSQTIVIVTLVTLLAPVQIRQAILEKIQLFTAKQYYSDGEGIPTQLVQQLAGTAP